MYKFKIILTFYLKYKYTHVYIQNNTYLLLKVLCIKHTIMLTTRFIIYRNLKRLIITCTIDYEALLNS